MFKVCNSLRKTVKKYNPVYRQKSEQKTKKKKKKKIERQGYDEEKVSQLKRETCCHLLPKNIRKKR